VAVLQRRHPQQPDRPAESHPLPDWHGEAPAEDEFDTWCQDPVTRFVATAFAVKAEQQAQLWAGMMHTYTDPHILAGMRIELAVRKDCFRAIIESTRSDYIAAIGS
jgi:hypothetical protein